MEEVTRAQSSSIFIINENLHSSSKISPKTKSIPLQESSSSNWPKILACLCTTQLHIPLGAVLGYSAILIPQLETTEINIKATKEDISWIVSVIALMVPLGSLVAGYFSDRLGRLNTLKVGCLPNILGWAFIATAQNIPAIIVGRILTGFSLAMIANPSFVYIPEVISPVLRGTLTSSAMASTSIGLIAVYIGGALLDWRTVAWLIMLYTLLPLILISIWSSESPVWLVSKGRNEDALKSLLFLNRNVKETDVAEQQLTEIVEEQNRKQMGSPENRVASLQLTFIKLLSKPTGLKPFLLLFWLFVFQQFSGAYIFIFYALTIFEAVGTTINPYVSTVSIGVVRLVFGLLTSLLMKHFGRRPLLIISGTGMAVTLFLSGYINKQVVEGKMESNVVPTVCILVYVSLSVVGLVTLPWTMSAEMFPLDIRGIGQGLIVSVAYILLFVSLKIYPFLKDMLGSEYGTMWLFAVLCLTSVLFVFIFLPETHNKTLLEIEYHFMHNSVFVTDIKKLNFTERNV